MLKLLRINNIALIPALEVEFGPGLTLLTGETGAGKSILIDALGLLLGDAGLPDLIRTGEERAAVEAVFEGPRTRRHSSRSAGSARTGTRWSSAGSSSRAERAAPP